MEEKYDASVEQPDSDSKHQETSTGEDFVAPGVAVVRTNTPRPLPFNLVAAKTDLPLAPGKSSPAADFPIRAPEAPPLPEGEKASDTPEARTPVKVPQTPAMPVTSEFLWLFEYGLNMDPAYLNRPERLAGSAFAYGPAVLKNYRLVFEGLDACTGKVLASIDHLQGSQTDTEVWGVLYRVPRRFASSDNNEPSLLDKVHSSETFAPVEVQVCEAYRQREIACITYLASETTRLQVRQLSPEQRIPEASYLSRLLQVARKQKLPASYLHTIEELIRPVSVLTSPLPATLPEQNTEPLLVITREKEPGEKSSAPEAHFDGQTNFRDRPSALHLERWLMTFATYVSSLLVGAIALVMALGLGLDISTPNSTLVPPGIPWYAFLYGLVGGCVSCIISLGKPGQAYPSTFVVLTWFARPFLGAFLGALACLLLDSGIILVSTQPLQHFAACAIVSTSAGFCEGPIFAHKNKKWAS